MTTKQELEARLWLTEKLRDTHLEILDDLADRVQKLEQRLDDVGEDSDYLENLSAALEARVQKLESPGTVHRVFREGSAEPKPSLEARVLEALGRWLVLKQAQGGNLLHPVTVAQEITTLRREFTEAGS